MFDSLDLSHLATCIAETGHKMAHQIRRSVFELEHLRESEPKIFAVVDNNPTESRQNSLNGLCGEIAVHGGKAIAVGGYGESNFGDYYTVCLMFELPADFQPDFNQLCEANLGRMNALIG